MWLLLAGVAAGASGALTWFDWKRRQRREGQPPEGDDSPSGRTSPSHHAEGAAGPSGSSGNERWSPPTTLTAAAIATATLAVFACGAAVVASRRRARTKSRSHGGGPPRIPLKELVRFREQQWFLEELENSREGDANAMLRLAKMYLYGQGCERSVNIAQEWLRRARAGGVYCTLDELLTAEDLESIRRQTRNNNTERLQQQRRQQQLQQLQGPDVPSARGQQGRPQPGGVAGAAA